MDTTPILEVRFEEVTETQLLIDISDRAGGGDLRLIQYWWLDRADDVVGGVRIATERARHIVVSTGHDPRDVALSAAVHASKVWGWPAVRPVLEMWAEPSSPPQGRGTIPEL